MNSKDFEFLMLCKDKKGIVRQVILDDRSVNAALEKEVALNGFLNVFHKPIESITWERNKKYKKKR